MDCYFLTSHMPGVIVSPCDYFSFGFYNPEGFIDEGNLLLSIKQF